MQKWVKDGTIARTRTAIRVRAFSFSRAGPRSRYHLWDAWMDGTDIVKTKRSAGMMEDNTAGFSLVLRRRLMTVDRISGFLQGASMPLRLHVSPIMTVRAALRYEALARDETVLARRARLAWLAYRMAVADGLFRNVTDPAVMDGLRWMLSTGITEGELFDAGLSSGIVLAAATCDDAYGFVHDVASAVAEGRRSAVAAMSRTRL